VQGGLRGDRLHHRQGDLPARPDLRQADQHVRGTGARISGQANQAGLPAAFNSEIGLPFPVQGAVRVEDQAQFHPAGSAWDSPTPSTLGGGQVFQQPRALDIGPGLPGTLKTDHGPRRANKVVPATHPPVDPAGRFAETSPSRSWPPAARQS
jgi:hypothetical protein